MSTTNTTTAVATVPALNLGELSEYARETPALEAAKQNVWNLVGRGKGTMDGRLQKASLALQGILAGYETKDQASLEAALKAYKKEYAAMIETRKGFTKFLDAAKDQCLKVERAYDPLKYEVYLKAEAREFELRKNAVTAASATTDKATETANFKTFVENEYLDIADDYRHSLRCLIHQTYIACLSARTPADKVQGAVNTCVAAMQATKPRVMNKFDRKLLTNEEALPIFKGIRPPNYGNIYQEMIKELQDKFALYANDLPNAEAICVKQTELFKAAVEKSRAQSESAKSANALVNTATAMTAAPAGMKGVTETTQIKIIDDSWAWVIRIDAAFAANFEACKDKVRNKKLSGLTVAQKAAALDAAGVQVEGVEYEKIEK